MDGIDNHPILTADHSVSTRNRNLSASDARQAFGEGAGSAYPVILAPAQLANLLGLSVKTIYEWLAKGRLDGAFRKRGKHVLIWRDRALEKIFNGPEWKK